jgi:hypothetical protein
MATPYVSSPGAVMTGRIVSQRSPPQQPSFTLAGEAVVNHGAWADGSLRSRRWRWRVCATVAEAERLINACEPNFRSLVRAGLETGCRYGELIRLEVRSGRARAASHGMWSSPTRCGVLSTTDCRTRARAQFRHGDGGGEHV